jgi:hypothetical protein
MDWKEKKSQQQGLRRGRRNNSASPGIEVKDKPLKAP